MSSYNPSPLEGEGKGEGDTDCEFCEARQPEILQENQEIWYLLRLAGYQWRVGMAGPTGLDFGVIIEMAKAMKIEINQIFFEKLRAYEVTMLDEMGKKRAKGHEGNT